MDNKEFSKKFLDQVANLGQQIDHNVLDGIITRLISLWKARGWVYSIGNGGSASTASHFVCDLSKFVAPSGKRSFNALCLSDNISLFTAWANDASFEEVYEKQVEGRLGPKDLLVTWSVHGGSGYSANLVRAVECARRQRCCTVSISGFDGGILHNQADYSLVVPIESTPHVEAMHLVLEHLICSRIKLLLSEI